MDANCGPIICPEVNGRERFEDGAQVYLRHPYHHPPRRLQWPQWWLEHGGKGGEWVTSEQAMQQQEKCSSREQQQLWQTRLEACGHTNTPCAPAPVATSPSTLGLQPHSHTAGLTAVSITNTHRVAIGAHWCKT